MIAVDTNVLARYLLNDDRQQAKVAVRLLAGFTPCGGMRKAWISVTLCISP
ncbi:MAG: hypothetical protein HY017_07060 [Betaproteobacteria bacterium]|nr:hypothetical protein [Betaproteobacteria bacterium]